MAHRTHHRQSLVQRVRAETIKHRLALAQCAQQLLGWLRGWLEVPLSFPQNQLHTVGTAALHDFICRSERFLERAVDAQLLALQLPRRYGQLKLRSEEHT